MEHKGTKELQTERLILRPWRESDAEEAFANWMNDPDVTRYLTWTPHGDISFTHALLKARDYALTTGTEQVLFLTIVWNIIIYVRR